MGVWTEKDWNHAPDNCTIPIEGTTGQGGPGCQSLPHDQNLWMNNPIHATPKNTVTPIVKRRIVVRGGIILMMLKATLMRADLRLLRFIRTTPWSKPQTKQWLTKKWMSIANTLLDTLWKALCILMIHGLVTPEAKKSRIDCKKFRPYQRDQLESITLQSTRCRGQGLMPPNSHPTKGDACGIDRLIWRR